MNKFKKSQVLMLFLLAITPLISSSLRSTYLYFLSNIIIITLGAEAGLFSVLLKPLEDIKLSPSVILKPLISLVAISEKTEVSPIIVSDHVEKKVKLVENSDSGKVVSITKLEKEQKLVENSESAKKLKLVEHSESEEIEVVSSLTSSNFFIENVEDDEEVMEEEINEAEEEGGGVNGKELFAKAEAFIGLFYKQLKMQKEESRNYEEAIY